MSFYFDALDSKMKLKMRKIERYDNAGLLLQRLNYKATECDIIFQHFALEKNPSTCTSFCISFKDITLLIQKRHRKFREVFIHFFFCKGQKKDVRSVCFDLTSDWLKSSSEFVIPITWSSLNAKPNQIRINFNTQVKTALSQPQQECREASNWPFPSSLLPQQFKRPRYLL